MPQKKMNAARNLVETGASEVADHNLLCLAAGDLTIVVEWAGSSTPTTSIEHRDGFTLVHCDFPAGPLGEYHISARLPFIDIYRSWAGAVDCWRGTELTSIALNYRFETCANRQIPVLCNYNRGGNNRAVIGMLDPLPVTEVAQRPILGDAPMELLQTRFSRTAPRGGFRETVVIYREDVPFVEAIRSFFTFCRDRRGPAPLPAPDWARDPVWCSWYSHLYRLTQAQVEEQIPYLKAAGIRTVLIDASWFHKPNMGLNLAAGDYEVDTGFFPDLRGLSRRLRDEGLAIMLWCAPFFMGRHARHWARMEPYCLLTEAGRESRLCPFCQASRTHAYDTAARLMREYELDGLKFDFMDTVATCIDPAHDHGDGNYGAAVLEFMKAARDGVLSVNPDAAIEYRIAYSTPSTLAVANCHRGNDAPYDADYIRRENLFLRLFCEYPSAVWNDYAYWHPRERAENVSLMLGQQVFSGGVPTLSVDFTRLSKAHRDVVRRWLTFYRDHRDALARATLTVHSADSAFSVASLQNEEEGVAFTLLGGQHVPARINLSPAIRRVYVLNASAEDSGHLQVTAGPAGTTTGIRCDPGAPLSCTDLDTGATAAQPNDTP